MAEGKTKRRLRPAETETVRQKTVKGKEGPSTKPKSRIRRTALAAAKPLKVFRVFRHIVPPYFKKSWIELKQVTWPSRRETWKLTFAVFMFAIVFGLIITIADYGLDKLFKKVLLK